MQESTPLEDTLAMMRDLRVRCDWDRTQTHQSLRPYLLEEAHEVDDAIRRGGDDELRAELGDLLLQVLFHSVIAEERGAFSAHDVARGLIEKMQRRHPHLYAGGERPGWERLKASTRDTLGEGLPLELPALHRAHRLQERAAGVGFDWPGTEGPLEKVSEELAEVHAALAVVPAGAETPAGPEEARAKLESELGDLLFACVNLCRKSAVHAALALDRANAKFERRFDAVRALGRSRGVDMEHASIEILDELWEDVKEAESGRA